MRKEARLEERAHPRDGTGSAGRAPGLSWFGERFAAAGIPVEAMRR